MIRLIKRMFGTCKASEVDTYVDQSLKSHSEYIQLGYRTIKKSSL